MAPRTMRSRVSKRKHERLLMPDQIQLPRQIHAIYLMKVPAPREVNTRVMLGNALSRWLPNLEAFRPGWILTTGSLIITTVLWIAARFPGGIPPDFWPWRGLSQITVLWSVTLMAIAMLAHVIFLALMEIERGVSIGNVFIPFWSESARSIDIIVFHLLLLLGGLAYDRRMRYERWLSIHRLTGLIF